MKKNKAPLMLVAGVLSLSLFSHASQADVQLSPPEVEGSAIEIVDIDKNGINDVVVAVYNDRPRANNFVYRIGWNMDANGQPKSWSDEKNVSGLGWSGQDIALAAYPFDSDSAHTEIAFLAYDQAWPIENSNIRYRMVKLDAKGNVQFQSDRIAGPVFGVEKSAVGADFFDIDENGLPELVVSVGNKYKIGWDTSASSGVTEWGDSSNTITRNKGADKLNIQSIALSNIDRNPKPELIAIEILDGEANYFVSWNLEDTGKSASKWTQAGYSIPLPESPTYTDIAMIDRVKNSDPLMTTVTEKDLLIATYNDESGKVLLTLDRHANSANVIPNGTFDSGIDGWSFGPDDTNITHKDGSLCIGDAKPVPYWKSHAAAQFKPIKGKSYVLEFDAKSDRDGRIAIVFQKRWSPYTSFGSDYSFMVKKGWHHYSLEFDPIHVDIGSDVARMSFITGRKKIPVEELCLDNVRIVEKVSHTGDLEDLPTDNVTKVIKNGEFNTGSLAGWAVKGSNPISAVINDKGQACVTATSGGSRGNNSFGQNGIQLMKGRQYTLTFEVASHNKNWNVPIQVKIGKDTPSYDTYFNKNLRISPVSQGDNKRFYSYTFEMEETDLSAGFAIFFKASNTEMCFDNITLESMDLKPLADCQTSEIPNNHIAFFGSDIDLLEGFNHTANSSVFNGLSQNRRSAVYDPMKIDGQPDASCGDSKTWSGVLVKKYGNWDQQHSNGIINSVDNTVFGDIDAVILDIKVNTDTSHLLSTEELAEQYQDFINLDIARTIDKGNPAFSFTLREGDGADDLKLERFFEIPFAFMDHWIRITIPLDEMIAYTGQPWEKNPVSLNNVLNIKLGELLLLPETKGNNFAHFGDVMRNFNTPSWSSNPKPSEYFKEHSVSIRNIALIYK